MASVVMDTEKKGPDTQKIKQSLALRAKYRIGPKRYFSPLLVVPHPKNRGGDPVKSLRTIQLNGDVAVGGYDSLEANCNAVAVEDKPAVAGVKKETFQESFSKTVKADPDMAEKGVGMIATVGSLSHSHWNCCMRNILGGKRGCDCAHRRGDGGAHLRGDGVSKKCECDSQKIVDDEGNYSMEKLKLHDSEWAQSCVAGLEWEVLSYKMDEEEPDAAQIISIALNKKK